MIDAAPGATPPTGPEGSPTARYTYELAPGHAVTIRELALGEFRGCIAGDSITLSSNGLRRSITQIGDELVGYADLAGGKLHARFTVPEMLILGQLWDELHSPTEEDTRRALSAPTYIEDGRMYQDIALPGGKTIKMRELNMAEFGGLSATIAGLGWEFVDAGMTLSDVDKITSTLPVAAFLAYKAAWEKTHIPSPEEMDRVRGTRATSTT